MARSATRNKVGKDPAYLRWIRTLPCAACYPNLTRTGLVSGWIEAGHFRGILTTEAHHAGDHGMSETPPDATAIPLCAEHHRTGKDAVHGPLGRKFWAHHGLDRDALIGELNARYQERAA